MVKISWTEIAVKDLSEIHDFIAQDSEKFAVITANKILIATENLLNYPEMGRIVPEIGNSEIREFLVGHYRLIYHLKSDNELIVLRIYSSWRELSRSKLK